MQYLISMAVMIAGGVVVALPALAVVTVWDYRDRKRHQAEMAKYRTTGE